MVSRSQRLCRLCEFPSADGGVPLDTLDADKWAVWCRRELGEELHISSDAEQHLVICQFCIWEARLVHESLCDELSENEKGCDWWMGHDDDHFFRQYFYKKRVIRPCKVILEKISSDCDHLVLEDIAEQDCPRSNAHLEARTRAYQTSSQVEKQCDVKSADGKSAKIFQCSICQIICHSKYYLRSHIKSNHKNVFRCTSTFCCTYFLTKDERQQHEQKFHLNGAIIKMVKCIYCGALLTNSGTLHSHIKTQHKEAIKCDYKSACPNYFHTECEKNEHIFNEHTRGLQLKMTPMKCIYCDKICKSKLQLRAHVYKFHKDVRIKCTVKGCVIFFLSQKESDEHFLLTHQHAESLKKWQCPKCSYKSNMKKDLRRHLQIIHSNKANMKSTFKCRQCSKSFPAKYNLKVHLNRVHADRCTCQFCGKTIRKVTMLRHFSGGACEPIPF